MASEAEPEERLLLPIQEAAMLLGLSRRQLYREMASGRLEYVQVGRRQRRIPRYALEAYIDALRGVA